MDELNLFMKDEGLPAAMRARLRQYFRYCRTMARQRHHGRLLAALSPQLRAEVAAFSTKHWVRGVPFFGGAPLGERSGGGRRGAGAERAGAHSLRGATNDEPARGRVLS